MGKIEITKREIAQLPAISCTDSHCKCTHLFPIAICHIQGVSLLQAKLISMPSSSVFPHLSSPLEAYSTIIPTLIFSLSPLSSCSCQLTHKHTHVPLSLNLKQTKEKNKQTQLPLLPLSAIILAPFCSPPNFSEWPLLLSSFPHLFFGDH